MSKFKSYDQFLFESFDINPNNPHGWLKVLASEGGWETIERQAFYGWTGKYKMYRKGENRVSVIETGYPTPNSILVAGSKDAVDAFLSFKIDYEMNNYSATLEFDVKPYTNDYTSVRKVFAKDIHSINKPELRSAREQDIMNEIQDKTSHAGASQIWLVTGKKSATKPLISISYEDVKNSDGYKDLIKMGMIDITGEKSKKNYNFGFTLAPYLILGLDDRKTQEAINHLKFVLTGSGYIRRVGASSPMRFLDKSRLTTRTGSDGREYTVKTGNAKIAFSTVEQWNEAFEAFKESVKKYIDKYVKSKGGEVLWYPGPEHRGVISAYQLGII